MLYATRLVGYDGMVAATPLHRLNYRLASDKKLRIALLTLITFLALC